MYAEISEGGGGGGYITKYQMLSSLLFIRPLHIHIPRQQQCSPLDLVLPRMGLDLAEPGALLMPSLSW